MRTMASSGHGSGQPGQAPDLRLLIDSAPALIHTGLPDGYLDFFNQTWLSYVGRSLEDLQGWKWTASIHPEDVDGIVEEWRAALASGEPFLHEARVRRADGEYRWMLHHKIALRDEHGKIAKWYGSSIDIEDRRRAEDDLRRSEAYLTHAQQLAKAGSWAYRDPNFCEYWSAEMFRIFGFDPSKGYPPSGQFLSLVHPEDRPRVEEAFKQHFGSGRAFDVKYRIIRSDGQLRVIRDFGTPVFEHGVVTRSVGACLDITEQEQRIEELQRSELYLAEAQRLSHTGSFGWNVVSGEISWSDETFRIFQYDRAAKPTLEMVLQRVHPEDRGLVQLIVNRASDEVTNFDVEYRLQMPDGAVKHLHVVARALRNSSDNVDFVGAVTDVTAAKQAEEKIRQNEKELRTIIETIPAFVGTALPDGSVDFVSQSFLDYVGLSRDQWLDWGWMTVTHPEDVDQAVSKWKAALAAGKPIEQAQRVRQADGKYRWFLGRNVPLRDEKGKIVKWYGTLHDVEDQRRGEEALRKSEEQWRDVFENNPTMYFMVDAGGKVLAVNPFGAEQLGYTVDELIGQPVLNVFYESDRAAVQSNFALCVKRLGQSMSWELRKVRKDGSVVWVRETARAVLRENDPVVLVACEDITERKIAEERVREQETELRQVFDLAPQHVAVLGADGSRVYMNQVGLKYLGLTLDEWRADKLRVDFVHPDDRERALNEPKSKFLGGLPHEIEMRLLRNDGTHRWFLFRLNPLRDEQGRLTRWYVAGTDIEDHKQAEERLHHENVALREEIDKASMFEEIVGNSPPLQTVLSRVSKVAPTDSTVLVTGETGTGKELVARAIHRRSHRSSRAFVSVNCAAIPRDLIASELFGHEKGAFTGALQRRVGRFELAEGGTIFLDEAGELPPETQIALLRVLQERQFERVGGNHPIRADVRVIAATNRDIEAAISAGSFRRDLFYRLNVFPIDIPPLRERKEDIPLLVEYFIDRFARKAGKKIRSVENATMEMLLSYSWPGNIRELQNVIERSVIVCETETFSVDPSWLTLESSQAQPGSQPFAKKSAAQEKGVIEAALAKCGGRVSGPSGAATLLGLPASTLESKIRSLKINKFRFKTD